MSEQAEELDAIAWEWRWVDDKGRVMTKWKLGDPPPVLDLADEKGSMHVQVRIAGSDWDGS